MLKSDLARMAEKFGREEFPNGRRRRKKQLARAMTFVAQQFSSSGGSGFLFLRGSFVTLPADADKFGDAGFLHGHTVED